MVGYFVSRSQLHYTSSQTPLLQHIVVEVVSKCQSHTHSRGSPPRLAPPIFSREKTRGRRMSRDRLAVAEDVVVEWTEVEEEANFIIVGHCFTLSWWLSLEQVWKGKGNINHICQKQRTIWWEANNYHLGFKNSTSSAASAAFRHHYVLYANIADAQYCWPHLLCKAEQKQWNVFASI